MAKTSLVRRNVGVPIERRSGTNKQVFVLTDELAKELAKDLLEMAEANEKIELNIVHKDGAIWLLAKQ